MRTLLKKALSFLANGLKNSHRSESRSIENPDVPLGQAGDIWGIGSESASGENVDERKAMRLSAFWSAVDLISGDIAKLPCKVYKRAGDNRKAAKDHPAFKLLRRQANKEQSAFKFWRNFVTHALVWGNAYAWIVRDGAGQPKELLPLLPDRTRPIKVDGDIWYQTEIDGKLRYFDPFDILHVHGISFDCIEGLHLVSFARDEIGKALARNKFASKFFAHGGRIGGILELPAAMKKQNRDAVEEGFKRTYEGADAAFKTVVLRENAKFHAGQATFRETQLAEIEENDIRAIARLFKIPPHKLGGQGTTSYNSLEQENRAYYDSCLGPWMKAITSECDVQLLSQSEQDNDSHFCEFVISAFLWTDAKTVSEIGSSGIQNSWMTPNEVRRLFNMPDLPGGDKLLSPLNMAPADSRGDKTRGEVLAKLETLLEETCQRFEKRIKTQIEKASKSDKLPELAEQLDERNAAAGSEMFASIVAALRSLDADPGDPAGKILDKYRDQITASLNH